LGVTLIVAREHTLPDVPLSILNISLRTVLVQLGASLYVTVRELGRTANIVINWNGRKDFGLNDLIAHVTLVLDARQLRECIVTTIVYFLSAVDVLNISCVLLKVRTRTIVSRRIGSQGVLLVS